MDTTLPKLASSWIPFLHDEFQKKYFKSLERFLLSEKKQNIYPPSEHVFEAFNLCSFDEVKVVILGQDPYHGEGQAHGLSFSVPLGIKIPPSLANIFKELDADLGVKKLGNGNLQDWAKQGVLLLNACLTVRGKTPGSHQNKGWEEFTDKVIQCLSKEKHNLVFLLWGAYAQKKGEIINAEKHLILKAPHPSPFSAHKGFIGCKHFSQTNDYLLANNLAAINW